MMDKVGSQLRCSNCHHEGCYFCEDDGRFYCHNCNTLVEDIVDNGDADEAFIDRGGGATYNVHYTRSAPSIKLEPIDSDHMGPSQPADFGDLPKGLVFTVKDYYKSIRMRYVLGVQLLIQYQCEKLVEEFQVNPVICGIAAEVWLRFIASKRVFGDVWADDVVKESESQANKKCRVGSYAKHKNEPRNLYRERMAIIWCKSLKKTIPLSSSLAVSYLACHIAREAVLTSDIVRWAVEGKLPYFGAFSMISTSIKQIERSYQCPSIVCPLEANYMFRPLQAISLQKLESMASSIAQSIGLNLPPVNFYPIASRYLKQLSLPVERILPYACSLQEWAMPPELWLSANGLRLPTRVCVMSILIVTIRILYNINGFGKWETSLLAPEESSSMEDDASCLDECHTDTDAEEMSSSPSVDIDPEGTPTPVHFFASDCAELLQNLEKKYEDLNNMHDYSKDLPTYLQYCKDVVFAGLELLYKDPDLVDELWEFYQKNQESIEEPPGEFIGGLNEKRSRDCQQHSTRTSDQADEPTISLSSNTIESMSLDGGPQCISNTLGDSESHQTLESLQKDELCHTSRDMGIRHMKIDMEEKRFCYIPPRVKVKQHGYLQYRRKAGGDGSYTYVAHADYYVLLRACAKLAQVDARVMHYSVLGLERRLEWIENRLDECLEHYKNSTEAKT